MCTTKQRESFWQTYASRLLFNAGTHPIEYAKVLIQIGHEPIPPVPSTSLLGKPVLKLPNIFQYVKHIKSVDGITGCYRGLGPKLCGNLFSTVATQKILQQLNLHRKDEEEDEEEPELTEFQKYIRDLKYNLVSLFSTIIVSQPFHVVSIRMMAQFVGSETKYSNMFTSCAEIYRENGVQGFFSGIVPRLVGDIISILLANTVSYAVCAYIVSEPDLRMYSNATISFLASAITYPFHVVSNCMAVSGSGLTAGSPPYMPLYTSWLDCWSNLSQKNQLKRGSSIFIRYYMGPQVIINGRALPITKEQFLNPNYK